MNIADSARSFFLSKKDVVKKHVDEVVRPGFEAKVEELKELKARALEILKPPVEHHASEEMGFIWRSFYGDAGEVAEESLTTTLRSLFLDVTRAEVELAIHLAYLPSATSIQLSSFVSLLKSLGPVPRLFSHIYQLLELPFYKHVGSLEAVCLLQTQPVGTYLIRRRTALINFTICLVESPGVVREIPFLWHEKEEGKCPFFFFCIVETNFLLLLLLGLLCTELYSREPNQLPNQPFAILRDIALSYPTSLKTPYRPDFILEPYVSFLFTRFIHAIS